MKKSNNYFIIVFTEDFLVGALAHASISLVGSHVQVWLIRKYVLTQLHLVIRVTREDLRIQDINSWNGELDREVISVVFLVPCGTSHWLEVEVELIIVQLFMRELFIKILKFTL